MQNSHPSSRAPENIAEISHGSIKMLRGADSNLNKASGSKGNHGGRLSDNFGSSQQNPNKSYIVPTHRRSNTAASFMPTMSLKQFSDPKTQLTAGLL